MFGKVSAGSLVVFLMLAAPAEMPGHGRNSTTFRANVEDASVSIELQAVVLDLLQLAGISEVEWEESPESAREATLRLGADVLMQRFRLVVNGDQVVKPDSTELELPDRQADPMRWAETGQRAIKVNITYDLPERPQELLFWELLEPDPAAAPILAQLLIRQRGDLVMLPAELGTGFPVRCIFDFQSPFVPLAERSSLTSAVCNWRNRPPNGVLEIRQDAVLWRVFIPAMYLVEALGIAPADLGPALKEKMAAWFSLKLPGPAVSPALIDLKFYPLSAHALAHETESGGNNFLNGMSEFTMEVPLEQFPDSVAATCSLPPGETRAFYTVVHAPGRPVQYFIHTPESPTLKWSQTP